MGAAAKESEAAGLQLEGRWGLENFFDDEREQQGYVLIRSNKKEHIDVTGG